MKLCVTEIEMVRKEIDIEIELDADVVEKINEAYHKGFFAYLEEKMRWYFPDNLSKEYLEEHFRYLKNPDDEYFPQFAFYEVELQDPNGPYMTTLEEFLRWTIRDIAEAYGWGESDERVIYTEGDPDPAVYLVEDDSEN